MERVTKAGSPDFVPTAQRIATFDNDGTLWAINRRLAVAHRGAPAIPRADSAVKTKKQRPALASASVIHGAAGSDPAARPYLIQRSKPSFTYIALKESSPAP